MGLRFRKSIRLGKSGIRLNLSKSGVGASAGRKGIRVGIGPSGVRLHLSLPGTGLGYEVRLGHQKIKRGVGALVARIPRSSRSRPAPVMGRQSSGFLESEPLGQASGGERKSPLA